MSGFNGMRSRGIEVSAEIAECERVLGVLRLEQLSIESAIARLEAYEAQVAE